MYVHVSSKSRYSTSTGALGDAVAEEGRKLAAGGHLHESSFIEQGTRVTARDLGGLIRGRKTQTQPRPDDIPDITSCLTAKLL